MIINGPNLNLLGKREVEIYGNISFSDYLATLKKQFSSFTLDYFQSNIEGKLIDKLHEVGFSYDYILLNAGGYTHTSVSLSDAISSIKTPVIEVHISNVFSREDFRKQSFFSDIAVGVISGLGTEGYFAALNFVAKLNK